MARGTLETRADQRTGDVTATDRFAPDRPGPDLGKPDLGKPDLGKPDLLAPDLGKPPLPIYTDALASDWQNWSWFATVDLAGSSPVKTGAHAVNVTLQAWGAFSPRKGTAVPTAGYTTLSFWIHGGSGADKVLSVFTRASDELNESQHASVTAKAGVWTLVMVPLASLGSPATIKRVAIQNATASNQPMVSVDELWLLP